ncbi:hypothetical protein SVAN01_10241 [Stagonosporopsis vannaccii]|nr:hypothetical protein SVAN01_10241 [Stagonosporopsis vannaccii]
MPIRLSREKYTVGWVCALPVELAAAQEMLDEEHVTHASDAHDTNIYTCGSIGEHNVVTACLPNGRIGTNSAAAVAAQMQSAFTSIQFGLMVGIGGGVPSEEVDIRLGDVVVSSPHETHGGVVQYDMGKTVPGGLERTGSLNAPPTILLNAVANLQAKHIRRKGTLQAHVSRIEAVAGFERNAAGPDVLFKATYDHIGGRTCNGCSSSHMEYRRTRAPEVSVYYGTIASGNQIMRSAAERDRVSAELGGGILCFEMEAAGLMNSFPCIVVRGICDYADSHKNKRWQPYAAGTAAAYAKELLTTIPAADVMRTRRAQEAIFGKSKRRLSSPSPDRSSSKRREPDSPSNTDFSSVEQQDVTLTIHHQGQNQTALSEEQKRYLLGSLAFEQVNARQMTIKTDHAKTCKWLLRNEKYLQWNDPSRLVEHHGFLWVKGKAGTGKSTLINARRRMKGCLVFSFFFNARGEDLEKSTTGAYRSLLLQLLQRLRALQNVFDSLGLSTARTSVDHQWTIKALQMLLEQAILSIGNSPVVCFVDALDECDEQEVREMIQFFEHMGDLALSHGMRFQVCFSSRHNPYITIRNGLELVLEGQEGHTQDITNYIEAELKIEENKTSQSIRAELQEKAFGIFMWVVLVVDILNQESDRGQKRKLQQKLREIPGDLHEMFRDILTRDTHKKYKVRRHTGSVTLLYLLAECNLAHLIRASDFVGHILEVGDERYGCPLFAAAAMDSWKALDVFLTPADTQRSGSTLEEAGGKPRSRQEQPEQRKTQFCLLKIERFFLECGGAGPRWSSCVSIRSGGFDIERRTELLELAVKKIWELSATSLITAGASLIDIEGRSGPTQLYMATKKGNKPRIELLLNLGADVNAQGWGEDCALHIASFMGYKEIVMLLLRAGADVHLPGSHGGALQAASPIGYEGITKLLLDSGADVNMQGGLHGNALQAASYCGNKEVVKLLLDRGAQINAQGEQYNNALQAASYRGDKEVVKLLLGHGADVNAQGGGFGNALQAASYRGNKEVVTLLLDNCASVNAQGGQFSNALQAASSSRFPTKEVVALLKNAIAAKTSQ